MLDTVDEAVAAGAQLLVVHHPLLLRGVTSVAEDRYKGAVIARLIRAAARSSPRTRTPTSSRAARPRCSPNGSGWSTRGRSCPATDPALGLGRVGRLARPTTLGALARALADLLPATASGVRVAGEYDRAIATVALCAGAGDSLLSHPTVRRRRRLHHERPAPPSRVGGARERPGRRRTRAHRRVALGERMALARVAAEQLRAALPGVEVTVSELRTDPWDFAILQ